MDASRSGWGATWGSLRLSGRWSSERTWHINALELQAILLALSRWAPLLRGRVISVHSDNKTVAAYLLKEGGMKSARLMAITPSLLAIVDRWGIIILPCYVLGIANVEADALSSENQEATWCILPEVAHQLFRAIAHPEVDLFAAADNVVVPRFFSIHRSDSKAIGLDVFHHPWQFQLMYAFPSPHLIL